MFSAPLLLVFASVALAQLAVTHASGTLSLADDKGTNGAGLPVLFIERSFGAAQAAPLVGVGTDFLATDCAKLSAATAVRLSAAGELVAGTARIWGSDASGHAKLAIGMTAFGSRRVATPPPIGARIPSHPWALPASTTGALLLACCLSLVPRSPNTRALVASTRLHRWIAQIHRESGSYGLTRPQLHAPLPLISSESPPPLRVTPILVVTSESTVRRRDFLARSPAFFKNASCVSVTPRALRRSASLDLSTRIFAMVGMTTGSGGEHGRKDTLEFMICVRDMDEVRHFFFRYSHKFFLDGASFCSPLRVGRSLPVRFSARCSPPRPPFPQAVLIRAFKCHVRTAASFRSFEIVGQPGILLRALGRLRGACSAPQSDAGRAIYAHEPERRRTKAHPEREPRREERRQLRTARPPSVVFCTSQLRRMITSLNGGHEPHGQQRVHNPGSQFRGRSPGYVPLSVTAPAGHVGMTWRISAPLPPWRLHHRPPGVYPMHASRTFLVRRHERHPCTACPASLLHVRLPHRHRAARCTGGQRSSSARIAPRRQTCGILEGGCCTLWSRVSSEAAGKA
ncbi:hypothetical protein DFH09DRAFT_1458673 [Mycena vulgaris]|nr:hypothetical protein DFH09DRAFT_1458673 [Mycena vulgaris]